MRPNVLPTLLLLLRSGHTFRVDWLGFVNVVGPAATPVLQQWIDARTHAVLDALHHLHAAGTVRQEDT